MTKAETRRSGDNSPVYAMTSKATTAINEEMAQNGWVDMRSFGKLINTPSNSKSFQRRCEAADVRTIIFGKHSSGMLRLFKAEDACKVQDLMQRINMETNVVERSLRTRNSSGRFAQERSKTLFDEMADLPPEDVSLLNKLLRSLLSQLKTQMKGQETT